MPRDIFLHEIIDIVGQGAWPYMDHTISCSGEEANGMVLLGTWYTVGCTGRWSQVINVWEFPGGWDGWLYSMNELGMKRKSNKILGKWWDEAYKHRTGGFDRQMAGVEGCPTMETITREAIHGSQFVHELSQVRAGAALEYLEAIKEVWAPIAADYGLRPSGLYEVLMNDTEVCTIWAGDNEGIVNLGRAYDAARGFDTGVEGDDRIVKWRKLAREYCTQWREELMTPAPGTSVCPAE